MNEKNATPFIIKHIQSAMNLYDTNNISSHESTFEIQDVSLLTRFKLKIPFSKEISYFGRPDAIIVQKGTHEISNKYLMRVLFEFKTELSIKNKTTQYLLEILAANLVAKKPVLLVQTNFKIFRIVVLRDNLIREVNFMENSNLAFQFISYWLHCITNEHFDTWNNSIKSIAIKIEESQNEFVIEENYVDNYIKNYTIVTEDDIEYCKKNNFFSIDAIENAYFDSRLKLRIEGRSGRTYKITIDRHYYALKLYCIDNVNDDILNEMEKEKTIYQHLGESKYWPKLVYAGFLFQNLYYGICTTFIKGKCYSSSKVESLFTGIIKENCIKALKELHSKDVIHKDLRFSNFIITQNSAVILDFGFSDFSYDQDEKLDEISLLEGIFS